MEIGCVLNLFTREVKQSLLILPITEYSDLVF